MNNIPWLDKWQLIWMDWYVFILGVPELKYELLYEPGQMGQNGHLVLTIAECRVSHDFIWNFSKLEAFYSKTNDHLFNFIGLKDRRLESHRY